MFGRMAASHPGVGAVGGPLAEMASQLPDPAQAAAVVERYQAYQGLREFGARIYGCLTVRPDAAFELCDAILRADHAVTSLAELSLAPEFRRGDGALYDALAARRIDEEKLVVLLTSTLPGWLRGTMVRLGWRSTTGSTTACWSRPWPACPPRRPPGCGR